MTWREIVFDLQARYRFLVDEASFFVVPFTTAGVEVRVRVDLVGAFGDPWLLLRAEVCGERSLDPRAALRINDDQALGTLSLWDGIYYLRHTAPLAELEASRLAFMLETLAKQAAALRRAHLPLRPPPPPAFGIGFIVSVDSAPLFGDAQRM